MFKSFLISFSDLKLRKILFWGSLGISLLLFGIAALICHLYGQDISSTLIVFQKDAMEYVTLAQSLLKHGTFSLSEQSPMVPELFRTPGYPAFIALVLFFFRTIYALPIIQAVLHAFTCVFIFEIGRRFFTRKSGVIAAVLYCLEPSAIHGFMLAMSDTLFQFLFLLMVLLFLISAERGYRSLLLNLEIGVLLGLMALVRPIAQFFPVVLIAAMVVYLFFTRKSQGKSSVMASAKALGIVVLTFVLTLSPWLMRNRLETGFTQISTISAFNIFFYNIPDYRAYAEGISKQEALSQELAGIGLTELTVDKSSPVHVGRMAKSAGVFLKSRAFAYAYFHLLKGTIFITQSSLKTEYLFVKTQIFKQTIENAPPFSSLLLHGKVFEGLKIVFTTPSEILFFLERLFWVLLTIMSFLSLLHVEMRRSLATILSLFIILYFWMLTGPVSTSRYRLPIAPFLFLVSAMVVEHFLEQRRQRLASSLNES